MYRIKFQPPIFSVGSQEKNSKEVLRHCNGIESAYGRTACLNASVYCRPDQPGQHSVMMPEEIFEMRKRVLTIFLAKPG
jgi:hypothetical protein